MHLCERILTNAMCQIHITEGWDGDVSKQMTCMIVVHPITMTRTKTTRHADYSSCHVIKRLLRSQPIKARCSIHKETSSLKRSAFYGGRFV